MKSFLFVLILSGVIFGCVEPIDTYQIVSGVPDLLTPEQHKELFESRRKFFKVFQGRDDFIAHHVEKTPENVEASLPLLAQYLVLPAQNDYEKASLIYQWITKNIAYDIVGMDTLRAIDLVPDSVLSRRKTICSGYSQLFKTLADLNGLETEYVVGFSKGAGYTFGDRFDSSDPNHAWNVVKIEDHLYVLDATWGAGGITSAGVFMPSYKEEWFLTQPEDFLRSHLPVDEKWQLVDTSITLEQFESTSR